MSFSGQCKMNLKTNEKCSLVYFQKQIKANDLIENTIQKPRLIISNTINADIPSSWILKSKDIYII